MFRTSLTSLICLQLALTLFTIPASADSLTSGFARPEDVKGAAPGSTFISGQQPGAVLIKVNLWGAVNKSGIHYIPHKTDFVSMLSFAGGPSVTANLEEAYIKRRTKDMEEIIPVNIKDIVGESSAHNIVLEPNDIIVIPSIEPAIDQNVVMTTGFIASILSIAITSFLLADQIKGD